MRITFILGNGFDIQLGLMSRYSDFLDKYVNIQDTDSENIKDFKSYLQKSENRELWSDAERAMGIHLKKFDDSTLEKYEERITDFEIKMVEYLEQLQNACQWDNAEDIRDIFTGFLLESFGDVLNRRQGDLIVKDKREQNVFEFVTFNYTNLINKLLSKCVINSNNAIRVRHIGQSTYEDKVVRPYHVHGELASQIIMGVNDESQLELGKQISLTDQLKWKLIKPEMNSVSNHNWDLPAKRAIKQSDIIVIYGVSFGKTDSLWWEEIRNWLEDNNAHKIVYFVRDPQTKSEFKLPWQERDYEHTKQVELLSKLGYTDNSDSLLKQVYIILNTTRLNLKQIILRDSLDIPLAKAAASTVVENKVQV